MADNPQLDKLDALIGKGVKSLFSEGDRVEFQSTGDLIKARDHVAGITEPAKPRFRGGNVRLGCSV